MNRLLLVFLSCLVPLFENKETIKFSLPAMGDNSNIDYTYPEFWFPSFDPILMGQYNFQNLVSRNTQALLAKFGDTVNVMLTPDLDTADDWTPGNAITATDVEQEKVSLTLDKSKRKTITLNATEQTMSQYELMTTYGVPLAKTILKAVNTDIYKELMRTQYLVDAMSGGVDEDKIVDARTLMSKNEASNDFRKLVASPDDVGAMLKLDTFQHVNTSGETDAQKEALIKRKFGFDIYENNIIADYTPADLTGAVNYGAGYSDGDQTIVVNGFDDDANPIREGDLFTIAGETTPDYTYHTVSSTTTTTSDTTGITLADSIGLSGVSNSDVITMTPSRSICCFTPDAVAFAARAYKELPMGAGVKHAIYNFFGLPIRISIWHDGKLGINVQYDILYGVELVRQERAARIITVG